MTKKTFEEYMNEKHLVDRKAVLGIALLGALFGAILMFLVALLGII